MKYFEIRFNFPGDPMEAEVAMCGKGNRVPTVQEANTFYAADVAGYAGGRPVTDVWEISKKDADSFFDMTNEATWPVFAANEKSEPTFLEAVITTYSYDSPTVFFLESQEEAIQYIKKSMQRELEIDHENGHNDSTLEEMEDELFGMRLLTPQKDGTVDEMCMILAQSVLGNAKPAARPKKYKLPQIKRWKKNCLCMSADEFDDICVKLYGADVLTHYDMDGLWVETKEDETVSDVDPHLIEDLTEYLGLNVTSVHIDDCDNVGVWIAYEEG